MRRNLILLALLLLSVSIPSNARDIDVDTAKDAPLKTNWQGIQNAASPRTILAVEAGTDLETADMSSNDISDSSNVIGDISPNGACQQELSRFCSDIEPGHRQAADCLQSVLDEESPGDNSSLNVKCRSELHTFFQELAVDVTKNLPLVTACREAIKKHCSEVDPSQPGAVLACLKERRKNLQGNCKQEVFKAQQLAATRFGVDTILHKACLADTKVLCQHAKHSAGDMQDCLLNHTGSLTWECRRELYRQQLESSDDVRLSVTLLRSCIDDKVKFCQDVPPGDSAVKDCLERHRDDDGFSAGCREQVEKMLQSRAEFFRLDSKIREYCAADAEMWCEVNAEIFSLPVPFNSTDEERRLGICLQDNRADLQDPRCAARVNHMISLSFEDVRFNHPLGLACAEDRKALCGDIPPGSARVIQCLMEKNSEVSSKCQAILFDQEVLMAENIDFHYPLKKACPDEIAMYCGAVPHGHGRVFRCLQHHLRYHKQDYSKQCAQHVWKFSKRQTTDYRLNYRLEGACAKTIGAYCSNACGRLERKGSCGGSVLRCLIDHLESISSPQCQKELQYFMKMHREDWASDMLMAEACRGDVETYCGGALAVGQDGAVLECLGKNVDKLSKPCRKQQRRVEVIQSSNIELHSMGTSCKVERSVHCPKVKPGEGRVYSCLMRAAHELGFGAKCQHLLSNVQERRLLDWTTDGGLYRACVADAHTHCPSQIRTSEEESSDQGSEEESTNTTLPPEDGTGDVLTCLLEAAKAERRLALNETSLQLSNSNDATRLVGNVPRLSAECTRHLTRTSLMALQFYKPGLPGTAVCDRDVRMTCIATQVVDDVPMGRVKACLSDQLDMELAHEEEVKRYEAENKESDSGKKGGKPAKKGGVGKTKGSPKKVDPKKAAAAISQTGLGRRRLSTVQGSSPRRHPLQQPQPHPLPYTLSSQCRAFLAVAMPGDSLRDMQSSLIAAGIAQKLQQLERTLGLTTGTFHDAVDDTTSGITLTGWAALAGAAAILIVSATGMLWLLGRQMGFVGKKTVVKKERAPTVLSIPSPSRGGLRARGT